MTPALALLFGALVVVHRSTASALGEPIIHHGVHEDIDGPCDASFPLAPADAAPADAPDAAWGISHIIDGDGSHRELRVAVPNDPTRRAHAPLCASNGSDGTKLRIDLRRLRQCGGGFCFVGAYQDCFHVTSAECQNPPPTVEPRPTPQPTYRIIETTHPVKLTLRNVPRGYQIAAEVRSSILRWVSEMLREKLEGTGLQLVRVEYAGRLVSSANTGGNDNGGTVGIKGPRPDSDKNKNGRRLRGVGNGNDKGQRRLDAVDLALRVTVRGPDDESEFALSYIMELVRAEFDDLVAYLKKNGGSVSINGLGGDVVGDGSSTSTGGGGSNGEASAIISVNPFDNVEMAADSFSLEDIQTGPTPRPSSRPTREPTANPIEEVVVKVASDSDLNVVLEDTTVGMPWWAWLIIVLVILLLCICCVCGCIWRRRRNARKEEGKQDQMMNIWMGNDNPNRNQNKNEEVNVRGSIAGTKRTNRTRRSNRPPRRIDAVDAEGKRTSRHAPTPRTRPVRRRSSLEAEEEEREFQDRLRDDAASRAVPSRAAQNPTQLDRNSRGGGSNEEEPASATGTISVDPPEELALVPLSSRLTGTDGARATRNTSRLAADLYYGGNDGRDRGTDAADVYCASPVEDSTRDPHASKKAKDDMFVCNFDELPKEVQSKARSQRHRGTDPSSAHDGSECEKMRQRKKKKKKKKTGKYNSVEEKINGSKRGNGKKRRSTVERLTDSFRSKPQDVVINPSMSDEPSIITMQHELRMQSDDEEECPNESDGSTRKGNVSEVNGGESGRRHVSAEPLARNDEMPTRSAALRRLSWDNEALNDIDDSDDESGSLGSVDIGL